MSLRKENPPSSVLGLASHQSAVYSETHTYDYEKKYPSDPLGEEVKENARFWKVYLDEAEHYDDEMLGGFKDTIDSLLVFAALFSGVVTTFVTVTITAFQPNYSQITATLLVEQVQLLRAAGNLTAINAIPSTTLNPDDASPGTNDIWINGLFFASLSLALATALLSVLVKQWLQAYSSMSFGNAKEKALIRQYRIAGFEKWQVPEIIGTLPLILHASLALFLIGLSFSGIHNVFWEHFTSLNLA
ncbi:hypothetical protein F5051DRAFT_466309 [Lentinula edodes]|nr:hypothetical protein F5051DRAFT_466309 [Lentinula edodes]